MGSLEFTFAFTAPAAPDLSALDEIARVTVWRAPYADRSTHPTTMPPTPAPKIEKN